ncbi:MAG: DUF5765 domain-containing protein [Alphaproteobacteria bacterium]|nr:DUF5765 domain-containing protein [Alphaproteobacteria bacterium]
MCWSGEASAVLASIGIGSTIYAAIKKEPRVLWITLGYFSLMELLQAFTYSVIDKCALPSNQVATLLGYLHIAFQPFFINAMAMHFIPKDVSEKVAPWVYTLCFASTIFMLIQLYPFAWAGHCTPGHTLCGPELCSISGNWHIAWEVPTNGLGEWFAHPPIRSFPTFFVVAFLLPMIYGSWKLNIYHAVMGPGLAFLSTNNLNERPAVWCLLSIAFLLIVIKTKLRDIMHVKRWFWWKA